MIRIRAYGRPAPQGSKRHVGHGVMIESSKALGPWREAVKHAALNTLALDYPGHQRYDCPLVVGMVFSFPRPRGHYGTGRNAHLLRASAPTHPSGPPDLSKLARSTEDALTDAGVWRDDARIVAYSRLAKVYATDDGTGNASVPGVVITVRTAAEADDRHVPAVHSGGTQCLT